MSLTLLDTSAIRAVSPTDLRQAQARCAGHLAVSSLTVTELLAHLADIPTKRRPNPFEYYRSTLAKCRDLLILPDPFQLQRVRFGAVNSSDLYLETAYWQETILLLESSNSLAEFYSYSPLTDGIVGSCKDVAKTANEWLNEQAVLNRDSFRSIVNSINGEGLTPDIRNWKPGMLNHVIATSIHAIREGTLASLDIDEEMAIDSLYVYTGYLVETLRLGIHMNAASFLPNDNDSIDELLTLHLRLSDATTLVTNDKRLLNRLSAVLESARENVATSSGIMCAVATMDALRV